MAHVLIVEDYPSLQKLYQTALEAADFEVVLAGDGEEALAKALLREPDVILLDLLMPLSGGLEFLRAYDLKKHPNCKVIVFSNLASPELFQEAKELGASQYLMKANLTPKEMADAVQKLLNDSPAAEK